MLELYDIVHNHQEKTFDDLMEWLHKKDVAIGTSSCSGRTEHSAQQSTTQSSPMEIENEELRNKYQILFLTSQSFKVVKKGMKRKISRQKKAMDTSASRMTHKKRERTNRITIKVL